MNLKLTAVTLIVSALAALMAPPVAFAAAQTISAPPTIVRVGVGRSQTQAVIGAEGAFTVWSGVQQLVTVPAGQTLTLSLVTGGIQMDKLVGVHKGPLRIAPVKPATGTNYLRYKSRRYRGDIEVVLNNKDGKLSVVNMVTLEEYVIGVLASEMPPSWHAEALKAQAVAARTYALQHVLSNPKFAAERFHVTDDTSSQVYRGVDGEQFTTNLAAGATAGQVLTYNGTVISAFFHSSSGGYTEGNEVVWRGSPIAYLRAVPDYDNLPVNPHYQWTVSKTLAQVADGMRAELGVDPGVLLDLQPGALSPGGRPSSWSAVGTKGVFVLRPEDLRWAIEAGSHVKELIKPVAQTSAQTMAVGKPGVVRALAATAQALGVLGAMQVPVKGAYAIGASGQKVQLQTATGREAAPNGLWQFKGGGWGHRVGMSQWGARGMAEQGKTYVQILLHYYTGTKVETR